MYKFLHFILGLFFVPLTSHAQTIASSTTDTLKNIELDNVVIIAQHHIANKKTKVLSSLDSYLESNPAVNMIKRGAYAWEPLLNGMSTERSVITIDGMRIYGACTDKMDPVTSYVEITNLSKANINNGQSGSAHGATIAGNIDLIRRKSAFTNTGLKTTVFSGFESNNAQKILGGTARFSSPGFFSDIDFTFRDAGNYKAGGNKEIAYSRFTKYNLSAITGIKLSTHQELTTSLIYDKATDIGYPALPMDVSLAEAIIGSIQYERHHISDNIHHWETKLYYNTITHIMDDSKRPDVPIRMDMPGWSKTGGYYSRLEGINNKHHWTVNLSGHYNYSLAEMTMFSKNPSEKDMFMLTWPGVQTYNNNLSVENNIAVKQNITTTVSAGFSQHLNYIKNNLGYESLMIFYPGIKRSNNRWLPSVSAKSVIKYKEWQYGIGMGFGERAPSVSEAYGYYLFNSADKYDYIGNPNMKNEKSIEINAHTYYNFYTLSLKLQAGYFRMYDYIIGKPKNGLMPMTIGAGGIKIYEQLPHANIVNLSFSASYKYSKNWTILNDWVYRSGSSGNLRLPQIQPLSYQAKLQYTQSNLLIESSMNGAFAQNEFSMTLGETYTAPYTVFNISTSYQIKLYHQKMNIKAGIENIFDKYYTTFSSWNKIPQMGRNFFINLVYDF